MNYTIDCPKAWEIIRMVPQDEHAPGCSYRLYGMSHFCDCYVLYSAPEYVSGELFISTESDETHSDMPFWMVVVTLAVFLILGVFRFMGGE